LRDAGINAILPKYGKPKSGATDMPFDGSGYERPIPTPDSPRRHPAQEKVLTAVMIWILLLLFLLPVSAGTLVDVVRYIRS